ncbi:MAG: SIS domain-containing protein [Limnochordales bacterium]|nr:SIS domain-containing protein [Limnochordales bacterium]
MEVLALFEEYLEAVIQQIETIRLTQKEKIREAARRIADAILRGHDLYVFGAGHAGIVAEESFYRAGGLMLANPIFAPGLSLNVRPVTMTTEMERMPGYAAVILRSTRLGAGDVLIIHSTSGRNAVPVEMAIEARRRQATVIAITSLAYSSSVSSRLPSGLRLFEVADLVIDNAGIPGDAVVQLPNSETRFGPTSTVTGTVILNCILTETVFFLLEQGEEDPPVFVSANLDGADEINRRRIERYRQHIYYLD